MENMHGRFIELMEVAVARVGHGFWAKLDARTGITALSWRSAYSRRQRPTIEMIEAIGGLWPEYVFWLVTGRLQHEHERGKIPGDAVQIAKDDDLSRVRLD